MDIYWFDINRDYVNKRGEEYWKLNPPESWTLGRNDDRIKYSTSECKAEIGDVVIFYQTGIKSVQHLGEVYKIDTEHDGDYVYFKINVLLKKPIPIVEIRIAFEELKNYPPQGGVSQMKDDKFEAGKRLIEFIENKSQSEK